MRDGANISFETDGTVTFYYDPTTHWATSDEEGVMITVPGSFQTELGCSADWDPACMRPWLQDKDGDGVYAIVTTRIPAGTWEFKVAHNLSWTESYPAGQPQRDRSCRRRPHDLPVRQGHARDHRDQRGRLTTGVRPATSSPA